MGGCRFRLQLIKQKTATISKVQATIYSLTKKMVNLTLFKDLCYFIFHFVSYIFGQIYIFLNEDTKYGYGILRLVGEPEDSKSIDQSPIILFNSNAITRHTYWQVEKFGMFNKKEIHKY